MTSTTPAQDFTFCQVLKSVGPKLVPFFKTVAIYFVLLPHLEESSYFTVVIKCLPIVSLIFFILLHGMSLGEEYAYSRRIALGLLFSIFGDALLVFPEYFVQGMVAFALAHVMYISAFGFKPVNLPLGIVIYSVAAVADSILVPHVSGVLVVGVPIYSLLLSTMVWRAAARVQFFEDMWTWTKLCSSIGGILFAFSDSVIGIDMFLSPVPYAKILIMSTYYAGQLGITLSVVDSKADYKTGKSTKKVSSKQQLNAPLTDQH